MCKPVCLFFLLFFNFQTFTHSASIAFEDHQLYEGSECLLKNGNGKFGRCTKAMDCPEKIREILIGKTDTIGHCAYSEFDPIVCCPKPSSEPRPAQIACDTLKKLSNEIGLSKYLYKNNYGPNDIGEGEEAEYRGKGIPGSELNEAPFMAALGYLVKDEIDEPAEIKYYCGGTLISEKHVLTAAHCVANPEGLIPVQVMLGAMNVGEKNSTSIQRIGISRITKHPKVVKDQYYNDIAILELEHPVKFTLHVLPACLQTQPVQAENTAFTILGWGVRSGLINKSKSLKATDSLRLIATEECSKSYDIPSWPQLSNGIDDRIICTVDPEQRTEENCPRDGGGPLLVQNTEFPIVVGIKSFGSVCGTSQPAGYTSVYRYSHWIEEQIWG